MSDTHFVESYSTDPVERAIARKVIRILNDQTLDRQQRESLVRRAQQELLRHLRERPAPLPRAKAARVRRNSRVLDPIAARRRELGLPDQET